MCRREVQKHGVDGRKTQKPVSVNDLAASEEKEFRVGWLYVAIYIYFLRTWLTTYIRIKCMNFLANEIKSTRTSV